MNRLHRTVAIFIASIASLAILLFGFAGQPAHAQDDDILTPGVVAEGELTTRDGDEWALQLCAGDRVTITMQSADFGPYLEIYGPDEDEPLAEAEADDEIATIDELEVENSGFHMVVAAGERRRDRGDYTLWVTTTVAITVADDDVDTESGEKVDAEPVDGMIAAGLPATGTLRARRTVAWGFRGCKGQSISVEVGSDEFDPYVELYANGEEEILVEGEFDDDLSGVHIEELVLPKTDDYIILVSGETRRDAGDYTLTLAVIDDSTLEDSSVEDDSGATPSPRPSPTPRRTPTPDLALCTVKTDGLNLRYGPGTVYAPPIGSLALGAEVRMVARDATANWVQVKVTSSGETGWVSSAGQYVDCNSPVRALSVGVIPPAPTQTSTPTPLPTPTPTPTQEIAQAPPKPPTEIGIGGGGGGAGLEGDVIVDISMVQDPNDQPTFRDQIYFRMLVWDPDEGNRDGDGIDYVEFIIEEDFGDFRQVHFRRENNAGYCSFGGGEPLCNVLAIKPGAKWPDSGIEIQSNDYYVEIRVYPDGQSDYLSWERFFTIDNPSLGDGDQSGGNQQGEIIARVAQTGPGGVNSTVSDALVFQVEAYDSGRGDNDGDGIRNVDMWVIDPGGDEVHMRTENNAGYCIFGGGEPNCNVWKFGEHGNRWPNDKSVQAGQHLLRVRVNAEDGRTKTIEMRIEIQP